MRINLTGSDIPTQTAPTKAVPVETIGSMLCEFRASIETLNKSVSILIDEVKGLRADINAGIKKADEGVETAENVLKALKDLG